MDHDVCPFLKDNKCSIYENRPLTCRAFPFINTGFFEAQRTGKANVNISDVCPNNKKPEFTMETTFKDMVNKFYEIYGDLYIEAIKSDAGDLLVSKWIKLLLDKGCLRTDVISKENVIKKCQATRIGLIDYLINNNVLTRDRIDQGIKSIDRVEETVKKAVSE